MLPPRKCFVHQLPKFLVQDMGRIAADQTAVTPGSGKHRKRLGVPPFAQHKYACAIDIEERCKLGEHTFGQPLHRFEVVQRRGGVDDDFQPSPGLHHALELLIAAQGRGQ